MSKEQEETIQQLTKVLATTVTEKREFKDAYDDTAQALINTQGSLRESNQKLKALDSIVEQVKASEKHESEENYQYSEAIHKAMIQLTQSPALSDQFRGVGDYECNRAYRVCVEQAIKDLDPGHYLHQRVGGAAQDQADEKVVLQALSKGPMSIMKLCHTVGWSSAKTRDVSFLMYKKGLLEQQDGHEPDQSKLRIAEGVPATGPVDPSKLTTFAELATALGYDVDAIVKQSVQDDIDNEHPYSMATGPIHDAIAQMNLANGALNYNSKVNLVGKDVVPTLKKRIAELEACLKSKTKALTEREEVDQSIKEAGHQNKVRDLVAQLGKAQAEIRRITREKNPDPDPLQAKLEDAQAKATQAQGRLDLELARKAQQEEEREEIIQSQYDEIQKLNGTIDSYRKEERRLYEQIDIVKNMLNEKTAECHDLKENVKQTALVGKEYRLQVEDLRHHKQMMIEVHQDLTLLAMGGKDSLYRQISRVAEDIESGTFRRTKVDTPVLRIARLTGPFDLWPKPAVYKRCLLSSTQSPEAQATALGIAMSAFSNPKHEIYDIAWQGLGRPGETVHTDRPPRS